MNMRTPRSLLTDDEAEITPVANNQEVDFSEYMWMAEEMEEFDQQVTIISSALSHSLCAPFRPLDLSVS